MRADFDLSIIICMKKIFLFSIALSISFLSLAQDSSNNNKPVYVPSTKDQLMIQFGYTGFANKPENINMKGFSRTFNVYFLFDFPFKTNPKLSAAIGPGISTSSYFFDKMNIDIAGLRNNQLVFTDVSDTLHFKKYKMMTSYLEAPVELRYTSHPEEPGKSFKAAIGVKVGTLVGASTKGKNLQNSNENTVNTYILKEKSKRFFNGTRISATARVGFGAFSLFGSYQLNSFVKDGLGPDLKPFMIGLTISGL